ncbi:MAG TPA: type II toxin-antitoxin system VapC family toxin [bacterium]|nr:type II toxin-antitoxin system VapC family toxin [bacterium]
MPLVLDASVALAWCFEDEASAYADRVQDKLTDDTALVPAIWSLEVANALRLGERRQRVSGADVLRFVELVSALPITVENPLMSRDFGPVLDLSRTHNLSTYDASYIELAAREGLPLATHDSRLQAVAKIVGVPLIT